MLDTCLLPFDILFFLFLFFSEESTGDPLTHLANYLAGRFTPLQNVDFAGALVETLHGTMLGKNLHGLLHVR